MGEFVQTLVYGLSVGSVYALVALGYSLIFSATRIVNFAQGTLVVFGGYLAWWLYDQAFDTGVVMAVVLGLVVLLAGITGVIDYFVAVAPLGRFDPKVDVSWLVTTVGAGIVIQELVAMRISDEGQTIPDLVTSLFGWHGSVVKDVAIRPSDALLVMVTLLVVFGLEALQRHTRVGLAFRAVAQDPDAASLMGINPRTMVVVACFVAGALAGLAGVLVAPRLGVRFNVAGSIGISGFVAAVIGGLGSPRGAILGGLLIGLVEGATGVLTDQDAYRSIAVFVVFVAVLAIRPIGLFGRRIAEKV
jgi:branched-chain amino acid transport system permease protein